jgi:hypothetical protein
MTYTVFYKPVGNRWWKKIEKVIGDGMINETKTDIRFFILEDNSRIEIPCKGIMFKFGPDRLASIRAASNIGKDSPKPPAGAGQSLSKIGRKPNMVSPYNPKT